jgi:hypothetical protein
MTPGDRIGIADANRSFFAIPALLTDPGLRNPHSPRETDRGQRRAHDLEQGVHLPDELVSCGKKPTTTAWSATPVVLAS